MSHHVSQLRSVAHQRAYKAGTNILFQGEVPRRGMLLTDGVVRAYTIASSGEERTISFYTRGDIIPISWLLDQVPTALFYYEALTDVRLLQFSKPEFEQLVIQDPEALASLFRDIARDYSAAMLRINGLEQSRADEKIAFTLYFLVFRYGKQLEGSHYKIDLQLRHAVIASLVGLSRESTTKVLRKLQAKHIISYSRGIYTIDKEKLESYIGEDSFRDLEI